MTSAIQLNPHFFHHLIGPLVKPNPSDLVNLIGGGFITGYKKTPTNENDSDDDSLIDSPFLDLKQINSLESSDDEKEYNSRSPSPANSDSSEETLLPTQIVNSDDDISITPKPIIPEAIQAAQDVATSLVSNNIPPSNTNIPNVNSVVPPAVSTAQGVATAVIGKSTSTSVLPVTPSSSTVTPLSTSKLSKAKPKFSIPANQALSAAAKIAAVKNKTKTPVAPAVTASTAPLIQSAVTAASKVATTLVTGPAGSAGTGPSGSAGTGPTASLTLAYYTRDHENPTVPTEDTEAPAFIFETDNDGNERLNGFMLGNFSYRYIQPSLATPTIPSGPSSGPSSVPSSGPSSGSIQASAVSTATSIVKNILAGTPVAAASAAPSGTPVASTTPVAAPVTPSVTPSGASGASTTAVPSVASGTATAAPTTPVASTTSVAPGPSTPVSGPFEFEESFTDTINNTSVSRSIQFDPSSPKIIIKDTSSEISEKDYTDYEFFTKDTTKQFNDYKSKLTGAIKQFIDKLKS